MMGIGHGSGMFGFGGGSFMMIVIILLVGYLIYLGVNNQQSSTQNRNDQQNNSDALEIAKSRLARGEITAEEYEQIKQQIS
ncbi:SHOCT domain-containing protein [Paraliobacillus salinarum]|uniref:SHOCT domain-containing protein n=1 Tax=Paraliobacillus salinarum TaxID=1158996 RepID=UPI0015F655E7|nr:SHOCT domain-containing protein [Paraliobacillus salinarum]